VIEKSLDIPLKNPARCAFLTQYLKALVDGIGAPALDPKAIGVPGLSHKGIIKY
jgi:hypothetical protein